MSFSTLNFNSNRQKCNKSKEDKYKLVIVNNSFDRLKLKTSLQINCRFLL